ncbi:MAG: tetratricopeptide repeat protein [Candidatus Sulfomarinibacteraceae bacterium]
MERGLRILAAALIVFGSGLGAARGGEAARAFGYDDWSRIVREKGLDPGEVIYPFSASPAMVEWAERAIAGGGNTSEIQRLIRVQDAMFENGAFDFTYDGGQTLTARQAFETRQGNCISFTALFVSLSRSVGVPTRLMSVEGVPQVGRDGDLVVINRHVVAAFSSGSDVAIFDFDLTSQTELVGRKILDDVEASAMFHNNLGGTALRDGDRSAALHHFRITTALWPDWPVGWVNLGVTHSHLGEDDAALGAYNRALMADPGNSSALMNMAYIYLRLGRTDEARIARLAAVETSENPYALVAMADSELIRGNSTEAARHLNRAKRMYNRVPEVFDGLARLAETLGKARRAARYHRKAEKLRSAERAMEPDQVPAIQ